MSEWTQVNQYDFEDTVRELDGCAAIAEAVELNLRNEDMIVTYRYSDDAPAMAGIPLWLIHDPNTLETWQYMDTTLVIMRRAELEIHQGLVDLYYMANDLDDPEVFHDFIINKIQLP